VRQEVLAGLRPLARQIAARGRLCAGEACPVSQRILMALTLTPKPPHRLPPPAAAETCGYRQTSRNPPANKSTLTWGDSNMKPTLWLLLGLIVGASLGWYVHGLREQVVRASANSPLPTNWTTVRSPILVRKAVGEVTT